MNADFFWILMGAILLIAIIVQIINDKRNHQKHRRKH